MTFGMFDEAHAAIQSQNFEQCWLTYMLRYNYLFEFFFLVHSELCICETSSYSLWYRHVNVRQL